ncbi:MAG: TlpA family protein disulfide reductase [Prevotella sp.]|nr:TlpA family protein disulfide reductase [Prevotella sp.]
MRKVFLMIAAGLLLTTSCKQKTKVVEKIKVVDSETMEEITDMAAATDVNNTFVDIALPGPQGQTVRVRDYVGQNKLVLIDFWASWCGPCIRELPHVVKAYDLYHDKGLEIVGVSLDKDKASWLAAIEQTGQKWPQMSDLKGWDCEGALFYGIQSIPANVLINEHGKIIARDLRGEDLLSTIAQQLQ